LVKGNFYQEDSALRSQESSPRHKASDDGFKTSEVPSTANVWTGKPKKNPLSDGRNWSLGHAPTTSAEGGIVGPAGHQNNA
jgi:hypothetical protein